MKFPKYIVAVCSEILFYARPISILMKINPIQIGHDIRETLKESTEKTPKENPKQRNCKIAGSV